MSSSNPAQNASDQHVQARPPSSALFGGMLVGAIGLMAAILLTYTLADWEWQQNLGGWNYIAAIACIPVATYVGVRWQPDETL